MKNVAWNLHHRAARRAVPEWMTTAIGEAKQDVVVLTAYVEGQDHTAFLGTVRNHGLGHVSLSSRTLRQNQVLIATREITVAKLSRKLWIQPSLLQHWRRRSPAVPVSL